MQKMKTKKETRRMRMEHMCFCCVLNAYRHITNKKRGGWEEEKKEGEEEMDAYKWNGIE